MWQHRRSAASRQRASPNSLPPSRNDLLDLDDPSRSQSSLEAPLRSRSISHGTAAIEASGRSTEGPILRHYNPHHSLPRNPHNTSFTTIRAPQHTAPLRASTDNTSAASSLSALGCDASLTMATTTGTPGNSSDRSAAVTASRSDKLSVAASGYSSGSGRDGFCSLPRFTRNWSSPAGGQSTGIGNTQSVSNSGSLFTGGYAGTAVSPKLSTDVAASEPRMGSLGLCDGNSPGGGDVNGSTLDHNSERRGRRVDSDRCGSEDGWIWVGAGSKAPGRSVTMAVRPSLQSGNTSDSGSDEERKSPNTGNRQPLQTSSALPMERLAIRRFRELSDGGSSYSIDRSAEGLHSTKHRFTSLDANGASNGSVLAFPSVSPAGLLSKSTAHSADNVEVQLSGTKSVSGGMSDSMNSLLVKLRRDVKRDSSPLHRTRTQSSVRKRAHGGGGILSSLARWSSSHSTTTENKNTGSEEDIDVLAATGGGYLDQPIETLKRLSATTEALGSGPNSNTPFAWMKDHILDSEDIIASGYISSEFDSDSETNSSPRSKPILQIGKVDITLPRPPDIRRESRAPTTMSRSVKSVKNSSVDEFQWGKKDLIIPLVNISVQLPLNPSSRICATVYALSIVASLFDLITLPLNVAWPGQMLSPSLILLGLIADVIIAVNQVVSCLTERTDEFGRPIHSFYTLFWIHFVSERGWILAMCTVPIEFVFLEQAWRNRVTENYWGDVADKDPFAMLYWAGLRFTRIIPAGKNIFVFLMNLDPKSVSRAVQRLIKSIATLFLVLHLFCCLMFAISQWDNTKESWAWNDGLMELTFMAQYSKSFYAAQLGIFFHLRQTNTNFERLFAILETLLAAIVFGVLFGVILGVVRSQAKTTASRFEKEESIREVTIRDSMVRLGIPPRLQDEVIRHRRHRFLAMKAEQEKWAFQDLPGPLCQDIYNGLYLSTVTACPLFKGLDLEICQAIARGISTSVLPSTTAVFFQGQEAQELFIIKRGRVQLLASAGYDSDELVEFAVLGPNQFLGESDIDETMNYTALTMEETEFCLITKCYLAEVCELFPKLAERIVQCMDSRARSIEHLQGKVTSGLMPLIPEVSDDGEEEEEPARPHDHRSGAILVPTIFTAEPAEEDTAAQAAPTSPPLESPPQSARDSIVSDRSGAWSFEKARTKSFRSSAAKSTSVLVDDTGKLLPSSPSNEARRASWAGSASKVGNDITGTYTPPITGNKKAILGSSLSAFRDPSFLQVPGLKSMAASDITHLQVVIPASPPRTPPCGSLLSPVSAGSRNPMPETRSQLVVPSQRQQTPLSPHNHSNSLQGTEPIAAGIQEAPPFSSPSPHREDSSQRSPTSTTSVRLSQIAAFSPDSTGANYANRSLSPPGSHSIQASLSRGSGEQKHETHHLLSPEPRTALTTVPAPTSPSLPRSLSLSTSERVFSAAAACGPDFADPTQTLNAGDDPRASSAIHVERNQQQVQVQIARRSTTRALGEGLDGGAERRNSIAVKQAGSGILRSLSQRSTHNMAPSLNVLGHSPIIGTQNDNGRTLLAPAPNTTFSTLSAPTSPSLHRSSSRRATLSAVFTMKSDISGITEPKGERAGCAPLSSTSAVQDENHESNFPVRNVGLKRSPTQNRTQPVGEQGERSVDGKERKNSLGVEFAVSGILRSLSQLRGPGTVPSTERNTASILGTSNDETDGLLRPANIAAVPTLSAPASPSLQRSSSKRVTQTATATTVASNSFDESAWASGGSARRRTFSAGEKGQPQSLQPPMAQHSGLRRSSTRVGGERPDDRIERLGDGRDGNASLGADGGGGLLIRSRSQVRRPGTSGAGLLAIPGLGPGLSRSASRGHARSGSSEIPNRVRITDLQRELGASFATLQKAAHEKP